MTLEYPDSRTVQIQCCNEYMALARSQRQDIFQWSCWDDLVNLATDDGISLSDLTSVSDSECLPIFLINDRIRTDLFEVGCLTESATSKICVVPIQSAQPFV